jgi:arginine deiminase
MSPVYVTSEISALRSVLVHTPGNELLAVTPGTREDFLYSDILNLEFARAEHDMMVAVLRRFAAVHEVRDLLLEVATGAGARQLWITRTMDMVMSSDAIAERLAETQPDELVNLLIEGATRDGGPIAEALNRVEFALPPLPNLFFTRDVGIVVGEHVLIGAMRHEARWTEELLIKALFRYHATLANRGILYDGSNERCLDCTLEGGDVHPVREDLLIVGFSGRSSAVALDHLCEILFAKCNITDVIVVVMPGEPTAIHLDMIFTQIDHGVCVVSPPHFIGPGRLAVLHRCKGRAGVREMPDLFRALEEVRFPLEPVLCGGVERSAQEREQWASGCNLLAVRPGIAIGYQRNAKTLEEFQKAGFEIVEAEAFLSGEELVDENRRCIITVRGSELVRGGGGPRCMTLPLERAPL